MQQILKLEIMHKIIPKKEPFHKKKDSPCYRQSPPHRSWVRQSIVACLNGDSWQAVLLAQVHHACAPSQSHRSSDITYAQHSPYSGGTAPALHRYSLLNPAQQNAMPRYLTQPYSICTTFFHVTSKNKFCQDIFSHSEYKKLSF